MSEQAQQTPEDYVLDFVDGQTDVDPEGGQMLPSPLWTSQRQLKGDAGKPHCPHPKQRVMEAAEDLAARGEILNWNGLLAPATDDHLRAIIESERSADITRKILVGKVNGLLSQDGDGDD